MAKMLNFCRRKPSRMTFLVAPIYMLLFFLVGYRGLWMGSSVSSVMTSIKTFSKILWKWFRDAFKKNIC